MDAPPPVFLVGSDRSGTTLLRKRLMERQRVYFSPTPTHFFHHLYHGTPFYGPLEEDANFLELISDAVDLCVIHFDPWDIHFDRHEVLQQYDAHFEERMLFPLAHLLMVEYAREKGYASYLCKDHHAYDYLYQIIHFFPEARFVYLYRDPRDVILSETRRPGQTPPLPSLAHKWRGEQIACAQLLRPPLAERTYALSYEDFVAGEEAAIDALTSFMNVPKEEGATVEHHADIHEWENLNRDTMTDNFGKYREGFPGWKNALIERICEEEMTLLGYDREYRGAPSRWHSYALRAENLKNRLLAKFERFNPAAEQRQSESYEKRMDFLRQFKHL